MRHAHLGFTLIAACLVMLSTGPARADSAHCADAGASFNPSDGVCELDTVVTLQGVVAVGHTLYIKPGGKITVPALAGGNALTLDIEGDLIIDVPSGSTGSNGISGDATTASDV